MGCGYYLLVQTLKSYMYGVGILAKPLKLANSYIY